MVGIVVVTHGDLAKELVLTAESIAGKGECMQWVGIKSEDSPEGIRQSLSSALKQVDRGDGVLVLTDMFGGTATNMALTFLEEGRVDVLTGVNLPMMLKVFSYRKGKTLTELAESLKASGQKGVVLASEVVKGK
ncbi:MAG: PTS sugar transporter subunit IIA [Deltaproteobacteria bacterium]|nr:PTS sugar transporter subunit IIA [Deltaproteobacteria bacterium]